MMEYLLMMQLLSIYEKERYGQSGDSKVDALITSGNIGVGAATATVNGSWFNYSNINKWKQVQDISSNIVSISPPPVIGVGIGTTATAILSVTSG